MNGTRPKCPNWVSRKTNLMFDGSVEHLMPCGDERYEIVDPHPFSDDSGLDPKAVLVRCKGCGTEYYVFPAIKYFELSEVK